MNRIPNGGITPPTPPIPPRGPNGPYETPGDDENLIKAEFEFDPYLVEHYPEVAERIAETINLIIPLRPDLLDVLSDSNVKYFIGVREDLKSMVEQFAGIKEPLNKYEYEKQFDFVKNAAGYTGCCLGEKDNPRSTKASFITFFTPNIIDSRYELIAEIIRQLTFSKEAHKLFKDHVERGIPMNVSYPRLLAKGDEAVISALEEIKGMLYPQIDNELNTLLAAVKSSHVENIARIAEREN
jgi:hypothetical protein